MPPCRQQEILLAPLFPGLPVPSEVAQLLLPLKSKYSGFNISRGFTLVEIMVVMTLLVVTLSFALPRLSGSVFTSGLNKTERWLSMASVSLRSRSQGEQRRYVLKVDIKERTFTAQAADGGNVKQGLNGAPSLEEASAGNGEKMGTPYVIGRFELPSGLEIVDVVFSEGRSFQEGTVDISFYKEGYADRAVIHVRGEDRTASFFIEPFLAKVKMVNGYEGF